MRLEAWLLWLLFATIIVAVAVIVALCVHVLGSERHHKHVPHPQARRMVAVITAVTFALGLGVTGVPAASASPLCFAGWCGRVTIHTSSATKCMVAIDGSRSNGTKGYHPVLSEKKGYKRSSTHYFKDTQYFRIATNCKTGKVIKNGKYTKTYKAGHWHVVPSGTSLNLVVR